MLPKVKLLEEHSDMAEQNFAERIKGALVLLNTSSGNKISDFNGLFAGLHSEDPQKTGVNFNFIDIGSFDIANNYVAEKEGDGLKHAGSKLAKAMKSVDAHQGIIRNKMRQGTIPNSDDVEIVSMVEDSEWRIIFDDLAKKRIFLEHVKTEIAKKVRACDLPELFNHLNIESDEALAKATFPGANLKPFQQHLQGGIVELMNIIYDAADAANMNNLHYQNIAKIAFGFHSDGKIVNIESNSSGKIISKSDFSHTLQELQVGKAITADSVHIPDGQAEDAQLTFAQIDDNYLIKSAEELPLDHFRRNFAVWLQEKIGTREFTETEKAAPVKIAYIAPSNLEEGGELSNAQQALNAWLTAEGFVATNIPTFDELRRFPSIKMLDGADVLLLTAEKTKTENGLKIDPNLSMLYYLSVNKQVDPNSANVPILVDNRDGSFNESLEVFRHATQTGRMVGDFPFIVAETDAELDLLLNEYKAIVRQSKIVPKSEEITPIPDDGVMSVFVAGGHANNNAIERNQAIEMGKFLASQDMRIVTGGGQIDGGMGGVHTGFVQYHLDNAQTHENFATISAEHQRILNDYKYDAENLILDRPDLIDALAAAQIIPAHMFFSYSTEALMKAENPNGELKTAGGTHQNVGNRILRMDHMIPADISLILPGAVGSYEEIDAWVRNNLEQKLTPLDAKLHANDNSAKTTSQMIICNEGGCYDAVLQSFGLINEGGKTNEEIAKNNNILVINDTTQLSEYLLEQKQEYPNHKIGQGVYGETVAAAAPALARAV